MTKTDRKYWLYYPNFFAILLFIDPFFNKYLLSKDFSGKFIVSIDSFLYNSITFFKIILNRQ